MGEKAAEGERAYWDRLDRAKESFRQDQITEGLRNLARIFEGGDYGYGYVNPADLRAGQTYYTAEGQEFVLPSSYGGQILGSPEAEKYAADQQAVLNANAGNGAIHLVGSGMASMANLFSNVNAVPIPTGMSTSASPSPKTVGEVFGITGTGQNNPVFLETIAGLPQLYREKKTTTGFDEAYHNRMRDAYMASATPQISDAYEKARRELAASLSRAGMGDSSVATRRYADLDKDFRLQQQQAASTAQDLVKKSMLDVADARSRAEATLYSSSPTAPEEAARTALSQANALAAGGAPNYSPMGVLFQNASAGLAGYADAARYAGMQERLKQEYSGLRSPSESSARTVRG